MYLPVSQGRRLFISSVVLAVSAGVATAIRARTRMRVIALVSDIHFIKEDDFQRIRSFWGGGSVEAEFSWRVVRVNVTVGNGRELVAAIRELQQIGPDLVVVAGEPEAVAIRNALPDTPMIFGTNTDPDEIGLRIPNVNGAVYATGLSFDDVRYVRPVQFAAQCCVAYGLSPCIGVIAEPPWLSPRRLALWRAALPNDEMSVHFVSYHSIGTADIAINELLAIGCRVCVTPHSHATVLSAGELSAVIAGRGVVQIAERFETLSTGATFAYEDTFVDWQPPMGQMIRMVMEGEAIDHIPIRRPEAWIWGMNRRAIRALGLPDIPELTDEFSVSAEA